ncbi:MAG: hypothetical protein H0T79_20950 [Deltaproteobacteria bacterium]|nr:hypothetical protein [Deltaproteobacteria bacterium]
MVLACSVLVLHHEADVAHVVDATGASIHAPETDCHERAEQTHMHQLPGHEDPDYGACALTALAHQATTTPDRPALVASATQIYTIARLLTAAPSGSRLHFIAPKTSPPRA